MGTYCGHRLGWQRPVDVRVALASRLGSLVPDWRDKAIAVDNQHYQVVGIAVDELGHAAQLFQPRLTIPRVGTGVRGGRVTGGS
jgi:hypothetical protein